MEQYIGPETYPDGTPVKSLEHFLALINSSKLTQEESEILTEIMRRSYKRTRHQWRSSNCHAGSFSVFKFFQVYPEELPNEAELLLVSSPNNHTWLEIGLKKDRIEGSYPRGKIIMDVTGMWKDDDAPYFGHIDTAPIKLADYYSRSSGYRIETLEGKEYRTSSDYIPIWDDKRLSKKIRETPL